MTTCATVRVSRLSFFTSPARSSKTLSTSQPYCSCRRQSGDGTLQGWHSYSIEALHHHFVTRSSGKERFGRVVTRRQLRLLVELLHVLTQRHGGGTNGPINH